MSKQSGTAVPASTRAPPTAPSGRSAPRRWYRMRPRSRVIENKQGLLTQEPRRLTMHLSRANTLAGGSLRTSTRRKIGA